MLANKQCPIDRFLDMQKVVLEKKFIKAKPREARQLYRDEHVVTFDEDLMVEAPGAQRKKQYIRFYEAIRTGTVMRGKVTSCYIDEVTDIVNVTIVEDCFKVIIPLPFLVTLNEKQIEKEKARDEIQQRNFLQMCGHMRVGSIIDYVPYQIDELKGIVIGSRLAALNILKRQNYLPMGENPKPLVKPGVVGQGRVCYVTKASMCVEIGGVEVVMRHEDISYLRIQDVQALYKPGDYVPVRILDVKYIRNEKKQIVDVSVTANVKDAEKNPQKENFNNYAIGESVRGRVVVRTVDGVFVRIENTECDVKCSPEREVVEVDKADVGDIVLIKIIDKVEEHYFLRGVIKWNYSKNTY